MNSKGKISIIVPVYDVEVYLRECISSIRNQTFENLEIILIDDGSPDYCGKIIDEVASLDSRVIAVHTENCGVSSARNLGLAIATGDYVCFVDADDVLAPTFAYEMLKLAVDFNAEFVISTNLLSEATAIPATIFHGFIRPADSVAALLLYPEIVIGCWNKLFSRDFLERTALRFDEDLFAGEGQKFIVNAALLSKRNVVTNQTGYFYRTLRPGSAVTRESEEKWANGIFAIEKIRENLQSPSRKIVNALDFHEWETRTLFLRYLLSEGRTDNNPNVSACEGFIRRKSIGLFFLARVPLRFKIKLLISAIHPRLLALIQLKTAPVPK